MTAIIITACAICAAVFASLAILSPRGWQDEDGFHLGDEDDA